MTPTYPPPTDVSLPRLTTSPPIEARERKVDQVHSAFANVSRNHDDAWACQTTVIVPAGGRTGWQWLASGVGAIGVTLLLPIGILAIGLPIAFALHWMLEALGWLANILK